MQKQEATPKDYIAKLKESFSEKQWAIVKKLHKKGKQTVDLEKIGGKRVQPEEVLKTEEV